MEITESQKTTHELLAIHWEGIDNKTHEKSVDIHKNEAGELLAVSIGSKEISAFELDILDFLKKEGKFDIPKKKEG